MGILTRGVCRDLLRICHGALQTSSASREELHKQKGALAGLRTPKFFMRNALSASALGELLSTPKVAAPAALDPPRPVVQRCSVGAHRLSSTSILNSHSPP